MARVIPPYRLGELVGAAARTFIRRGYRSTQVADVARNLGVAKGTLYGYVESKEALFDAALRYADGHLPLPPHEQLPLPTPSPGATVAHVRERLVTEAAHSRLARAVCTSASSTDIAGEVEAVLSDLYQRLARNRLAVKLVDRCAVDHPELARIWFAEGRWAQHRLLVEWLEKRTASGCLRATGKREIVARIILETIVFWAIHRHFDPSPQPVADAEAERAVIDLLSNGLLRPA